MDTSRFDRLTAELSRRGVLRRFTVGGLGLSALLLSTEAEGKRSKKHRKKRRCAKSRRCGKKRCCATGQICAGGTCIVGEGSCAAGADSCTAGVPVLCAASCACVTSTEGDTRCIRAGDGAGAGPCGGCTSSADCAAFGAGAVCVAAGIGCGCQAGEGMCAQPCAE